jgi:hypothetical protein
MNVYGAAFSIFKIIVAFYLGIDEWLDSRRFLMERHKTDRSARSDAGLAGDMQLPLHYAN